MVNGEISKWTKTSKKSQTVIELLPSAYSASRNENFVSLSKHPLKNENSTFPAVHYFTWNREFVLNIL